MISAAPDGSARLIPRIFTDDPVGLVAFIRTAFEATAEVVPDLVVGRVGPQRASLNPFVLEDQPYGEDSVPWGGVVRIGEPSGS
jgi:hypothetical protein